MPDILYQFHGTNGSVYVAENCLVVSKQRTLTIPLDQIVALEYQEGKFLQEGCLIIHTNQEKDHYIFEQTKDYENVISVSRRDTALVRSFINQVEEFLYTHLG